MKKIIQIMILIISLSSYSQTGIIKGRILDSQSELPLEGVTIELLNTNPAVGTTTNEEGYYRLENVPIGRQEIQISYIGFETLNIPNIVVTSGKDVIINGSLVESFDKLDEIVITSKKRKDRPVNNLAAISARQFGLEEVTRYSGGRGDVGRLAANFAGVSSPDDSRNDIVIRGNSPTGLLWRLEGIPIPNPNHFASFGTTGGPVSAVNSNALKNSDFITSAFPSEYGNAIGGVFDLGFRKGNKDEYEYTFQTGVFTGLEAMAEGPLGKNNGSFMIGFRYSLVGLIGAGAAGGSAATPNYYDLSFNIDFGESKSGNFSLFGIFGNSDINFLGDEIDENDLFAAEDEDLYVESGFGVVGLKHQINIGKSSYLRSVVATSFSGSDINADRYINKDTPQERLILYTESDDSETRWSFSTLFNSKLSNRTTLRIGALLENFSIESVLRDREEQPDNDLDGDPDLTTFRDIDESFSIFQHYVQGQFRLTEKVTLNIGLHGQYSSINEQLVIEPRTSLNYRATPKSTFSLGFGIHNQPVSFPILFLTENVGGNLVQSNRNLDFVRSVHYVLGYDLKLGRSWRAKAEVYYQNITNAAVDPFSSSYSSLTEGADFEFDNNRVSLVNDGTGFNQGIEFTLEKFFSNNYYGLLTASFFESKYEGSDGIERNSPFNNGYVINFLTGREFAFGAARKNTIFFDTRVSFSGGRYFTPINLEASQANGFQVLREDLAFTEQNDPYFRWDVKFGFKLNSKSKKRSHQLYFDLQNITNRANIFLQRYNRLTNRIDQVDQIGFFPDFGYRFQF